MDDHTTTYSLIKGIVLSFFTLLWLGSAQASDCLLDTNNDGNADTNVDTDGGADSSGNSDGIACGRNAKATGLSSTALGEEAFASGSASTAVGFDASAAGRNSTALGAGANATEISSTAVGDFAWAAAPRSTALGRNATAAGIKSTALGVSASAYSFGAVSLGFGAGFTYPYVRDSPEAISIGNQSDIAAASPGAIAIGGDVNGDNVGARATAPGAIAIGADVVANKAHTLSVGVPIQVKGSTGTTQLLINEKSASKAVKILFSLICDTCTPGFRFNQLLPSNNTWFFRMLQSGNFSVDDPATMTKEAEFRSGGDLKIGGTLIQGSSRDIKKNVVEVKPVEVLDKLATLPIYHWSYTHNPDRIRHMGPMSEDFYKVFGLGDTDKGIAGVDSAGVALAAIKSLNQANQRLKADTHKALSKTEQALARKDQQIVKLMNQNKMLSERMQVMETKLIEVDELKQQLAAVLAMTDDAQLAQVVSD